MSALAVHPLEQLVLQPHADPEVERGAPQGPRRLDDREREDARAASLGADDLGGEPSLDALVSGMWEGLAAHRSVACPLCGGEVVPLYGAHHHPVGGRCQGCGTSLD